MDSEQEKLYQEHINELFGSDPIDEYSEQDINRLLERLLKCLPNNGKLYKYRSIEGTAFDNAFDGLSNGYIYMAKASELNDDLDCTLNFDIKEEVEKQRDLFYKSPWLFLSHWVNKNAEILGWKDPVDIWAYQTVMTCVDKQTDQLDEEKAIAILKTIGVEETSAKKYIKDLLEFVSQEIEKGAERIAQPLGALANYNDIARQDSYVFSMSETFDSNSMWALYANTNKGFCIEYDFNKAKDQPFTQKRLLVSLFKVKYLDELEKYSFVDMHKYFMTGKQDKALFAKANLDALEKLITKTREWEHEKEWRIFLCNLDENNKIYADIVSGIIIDERALVFDNGKKLISFAKQHNWQIRIRRRCKNGSKHEYIDY